MELDLPSEILRRAEVTSFEARLILAVQLYADGRIDHTDACELARVSPAAMTRELTHRGISVVVYPVSQLSETKRAG